MLMSKILNGFKRFFRDEDAPTMVEYGLLVALIAIVVLVGVRLLGDNLLLVFNDVAGEVGGGGGG